jgi:hypothetical protein
MVAGLVAVEYQSKEIKMPLVVAKQDTKGNMKYMASSLVMIKYKRAYRKQKRQPNIGNWLRYSKLKRTCR